MRARRILSGAEYKLVPLTIDGTKARTPDGRLVMVPENPFVRTGKTGRGELGRYGENWAGDLALVRYKPGCEPSHELKGPHRGADVQQIYQGPCDDPRNEDNAWLMTTVFTALLTGDAAKTPPKPDSDASAAEWIDEAQVSSLPLFASHADYIRGALSVAPADGLPKQILLIFRNDGSESWGVPGGMADPGEAPIQTATREAGEEAGKAIEEAVALILAARA